MRHITLLTDFGVTEGEHTVMKGVIWRILPGASIADLTHEVAPQSIHHAAIILERVAHFFPAETVHVVVVDPGVGTARRPIAARFGEQLFVGPDNGVCTPLLERAERLGQPVEIVHLDKPEYWLEDVTAIFHGRDIFAPAGGHLAAGVPLTTLGTPIPVDDVIRYHTPTPEPLADGGWQGEVIHIDHFGNILTNLPRELIEPLRPIVIEYGETRLDGMVNTFGERPVGTLVALYSPHYQLMLAEVNGSAARVLNPRVGDKVVTRPAA